MYFKSAESFVMICGIVNDAIALINESFGAAVLGGVFNIGFVVGTLGECCMIVVVRCVIVEFVSANHHANRCPRVKIPLFESLAGFGFVKILAFVFINVIRGQFVEFAQVCGHGISGGVFTGFLYRFVDRLFFVACLFYCFLIAIRGSGNGTRNEETCCYGKVNSLCKFHV